MSQNFLPQPRLFVFDVNAASRARTVELLEKAGHQLLAAGEAEAARKLLTEQSPTVAVVAVRERDDDAFNVLNHIRSDAALKETQILRIFSESMLAAEVNAEPNPSEIGACLAEPFQNAELLGTVRALVNCAETIISVRRESERNLTVDRQLGESEERYRVFVEQSSEGIWRMELLEPIPLELSSTEQIERFYHDAYIAECNDAMAQMYGFGSARELIGIRLDALYDRSDPKNTELLRAFIESGYRLSEVESHEFDQMGRDIYFLNNFVGIIEDQRLTRAWGTQREVTERKKIEQRLRESEERLRLATEAGEMATLDVDLFNHSAHWSESLFRILGYTSNADGRATDEMWRECIHEDDRARVLEDWSLARGERKQLRVEHRIRRRDDNEVRWLSLNGRFMYDERGAAVRFVGVFFDVTRRKQAVENLRQSEEAGRKANERFELIARATNDAIWDWNLLTDEVLWNDGVRTMFGYEPDQVKETADWWYEHIHPEDRDRIVNGIHHAIDNGESGWTSEYRYRRADESFATVFDRGYIIHDETGKSVRMVGSMMDITERQRFERALSESELRLTLATDAAQVGTWQWEVAKDQIIWSDLHRKFWGFPSNKKLTLEDWAGGVYPDDLPAAFASIEAARTKGVTYDAEYRVTPTDTNSVRWMRSTGQFAFDETGEPTTMSGVTFDITERKRNEREREILLESERRARAEAEAANRAKDEFLAVLSHELRTPLNAMFGWVRMLNTGGLDEAMTRRAIEVIERNINLQTKLIEDILDVSRIISGKIRLEMRGLDLVSLVNSVIDQTSFAAETKHIRITTRYDVPAAVVNADAERLQQVIGNLLNNAVKFTPANGEITVATAAHEDKVRLLITDTGIGINPEFLPRVFDRFRQADSSSRRKHGGLGLGLAIVKHLIDLHNGRVWAESEGEGQGATFAIELPLQIKRSETDSDAETAVETNGNVLQDLHVLLVEDDPDALEMLRTLLETRGARVVAVNTALLALQKLQSEKPNLLISDVGLPEMDGIEFIGRVRRAENRANSPALPAIALTAYASVEDRQRILAAGFNEYLSKPLNFGELSKITSKLLGSKTTAAENEQAAALTK